MQGAACLSEAAAAGRRDSGRLAGKVALVTGAGRGIGRAIAQALAEEGAAVSLLARTAAELEQTAAELRAQGRRALAVEADVSDPAAVERALERTLAALGGIHILVNNAAVLGPVGPLADNDPKAWIQTVQVNLVGPYLCSRAVLPEMMRQRWGRIINLSGGGATGPRRYFSAYAASKAALVRLTETLAEEVRGYNIQVNAIAPGAVHTRMLEEILQAGARAGQAALEEARRQIARRAQPDRAAELAVFLASEESRGLTGKLISAPHDDWERWDAERIGQLMSAPWLALRRLDAYTIGSLTEATGQLCELAWRVAG
jgi:NAD(P)-dependent dehydrogenase (short-subunit alcohol dehydrogenase family)